MKNNNSTYCIPIIKQTQKDVIKTINKNKKYYDFFEIWIDYIIDIDIKFIEKLKEKLSNKLSILFRRQNLEPSKLDWEMRKKILHILNESNVLVDFDLFSQNNELNYVKKQNLKVRKILSYHNYKETPSKKILESIIKKMERYSPEIYKISTFFNKHINTIIIF